MFGAVLLLRAPSPDALYILLPLVSAIWICGFCIVKVWRRDGEIPVLDAGVLCVVFTTLYIVVPLLNFYLGGLDFGLFSDARLRQYRPAADELGLFFVNHVVYLAMLAFGYLLFRRSNRSLPRFAMTPPQPVTMKLLISAFLVVSLYFAVLLYIFGIGFRSGYGDEVRISTGPLWLAQINGKLSEMNFIVQAAVIGFLVLRKNDLLIRVFLFLLIAWNVVIAFVQPGSRGELMSLLLLTFLFWHKFHGAPWRFTLVFLPTTFAAFMFIGLLRSFLDLNDLALALDAFETLASATNEFQAMLGTSFDVKKMLEGGVSVPAALAFNDIAPMLPPQQLWPFQKLSGADWYLIQIGLDGTGAGFMWSVISQALVGFGLVELAIRGLVLGCFLAYLHRWYQRRYTKFIPTVIYTVLCLTSLWTFRDTTGAILWTIWWSLIPLWILFRLLGLRHEFVPSTEGPNHRDNSSSAFLPPAAGAR